MGEDLERKLDRITTKRIDEPRFKIKDKDLIETVEEVFDKYTLESLYEIMRKLRLLRMFGVVNSGKEARIYRAIDKEGKEYAVKIYLTFTSEFKKGIWKYIMGDPRFENAKITSTKKLMYLWARKEYKNLERMFRAGVRVPKPYGVHNNIVVMEFIGKEGVRAPLLKEYMPDVDEGRIFFEKIIDYVKKMVCKSRLVHADLSEYNVMIFDNEPIIIDVAQAVTLDHPNALDFLSKDINNIHRFFSKEVGLEIPSQEELKGEIIKCL